MGNDVSVSASDFTSSNVRTHKFGCYNSDFSTFEVTEATYKLVKSSHLNSSLTCFSFSGNDDKVSKECFKNALVLRSVRHPSIVKFLDAIQQSWLTGIVTELVSPLENYLQELFPDEAVQGFHSICSALAFLHTRAQLSHNNVSERSIYCTSQSLWKLGNFELCQPFSQMSLEALKKVKKLLGDGCAIDNEEAAVPFLLQKWEASNLAFGYLQTTFAAVQLLGGPVFGRFGDLYGARLALCLAFGASGVSCLIVAVTDGLFWMFVSRLPLLVVHAMQGGQMVVTDLSDPMKRSESLAKLGLSYGVGMVLGSLSSGFIIKATSEHSACFLAAILSFASMVAIWLTIPASLKAAPVMSSTESSSASSASMDDDSNETGFKRQKSASSSAKVFDVAKFSEFLIKNHRTRWLLAVKVVTGIPIGLLQSMMPIISVKQLGATPQISGIMMAFVAIVSMAVQGLGISVLTKRFSDSLLLTAGCVILTFGYFLLTFLGTQIYYLFVCIFPLVIGLTLINVLVSSALTNAVPLEDTGSVLGINMAINSVIRIASPTLGGLMLDNLGVWSFGFLGSVNSALVAAYMFRTHLKSV